MAVGSSNDFDLVVLGAGTGGYAAAFRAAQLGLKVALVDEGKIGGTCLHRGCIPTKALLESAAFLDRLRHAKDYGFTLPGEPVVDYAAMAAKRDAVVKRMWTGLKTLIDKNKVTWVAGRGRLDGPGIRASLLQATRTAAAVFTVLIGALLFGYFLTITQVPQKVTGFMTGLGIGRYGVLAIIMVMYLILGCLMDAMAMIILTVPIIFPVVTQLGFDPIWFGVIIVMTVELGLIHPPVGMNVFVIKSVVKDVSFSTIFRGVLPFVATDLIRLVILIAFPILALWLPQRMAG